MEDGQEVQVDLLSPEGFLQGLQDLGLHDLTEIEC